MGGGDFYGGPQDDAFQIGVLILLLIKLGVSFEVSQQKRSEISASKIASNERHGKAEWRLQTYC